MYFVIENKKSKKYRHGHKLKSKRITTKKWGRSLKNNGTVLKKKGKWLLKRIDQGPSQKIGGIL